MKQITVFEGIIDTDSGWNYDIPIILIKPVYRFCIGNNLGYINNIIEDYMIDVSLGLPEEQITPKEEDAKLYFQQQYERAKKNKGNMKYWSRTIEWDPSDLEYCREIARR